MSGARERRAGGRLRAHLLDDVLRDRARGSVSGGGGPRSGPGPGASRVARRVGLSDRAGVSVPAGVFAAVAGGLGVGGLGVGGLGVASARGFWAVAARVGASVAPPRPPEPRAAEPEDAREDAPEGAEERLDRLAPGAGVRRADVRRAGVRGRARPGEPSRTGRRGSPLRDLGPCPSRSPGGPARGRRGRAGRSRGPAGGARGARGPGGARRTAARSGSRSEGPSAACARSARGRSGVDRGRPRGPGHGARRARVGSPSRNRWARRTGCSPGADVPPVEAPRTAPPEPPARPVSPTPRHPGPGDQGTRRGAGGGLEGMSPAAPFAKRARRSLLAWTRRPLSTSRPCGRSPCACRTGPRRRQPRDPGRDALPEPRRVARRAHARSGRDRCCLGGPHPRGGRPGRGHGPARRSRSPRHGCPRAVRLGRTRAGRRRGHPRPRRGGAAARGCNRKGGLRDGPDHRGGPSLPWRCGPARARRGSLGPGA